MWNFAQGDNLLWDKTLSDIFMTYSVELPRVCRALRCTEDELRVEIRNSADVPGMTITVLYKMFGILVVKCDRLQLQPLPEMIKDCVMYASIEELSKMKL